MQNDNNITNNESEQLSDIREFGPGRGKGKKAEWPTVPRDARYWTSLEQYNNDSEFQKQMENEFQSSPLAAEDESSGWARRDFLKLMGASVALGATGCIRRPVQKIVPYNKQPEEVVFTVPNYYSSTWFDGSESFGLLVKTREGRPIKIEGNPAHPSNLGATSARCEAHLLSLYDPERLKGPMRNLQNKERTNRDTISAKWEDTDKLVSEQLKKGGVVLLTGNVVSPTTRQVIADFFQGFNGRHVSWEPLSHDELKTGSEKSYGTASVPDYRFDKADLVVSIDADFLGAWLSPVKFTRRWSKTRKPGKDMSRLYVFDSNMSLTGMNADLRYKIKPSQQLSVVMGILHEIIVKKKETRYAGDTRIASMLEPYAGVAAEIGMSQEQMSQVASDLIKNRGKSLVVAGGLPTLTFQATDLQVAVNFLNNALDNEGKTVEAPKSSAHRGTQAAMAELIADMATGKVKTLVINRANPMYGLPHNSGFADAVKKCEMVIYTGDRNDETGLIADYILPDSHSLETWSDAEIMPGVYTIQQPTIEPLYDTRSIQYQLMTWAYTAGVGPARLKDTESFYDYLRNYWKSDIAPAVGGGKAFDSFWDETLQKGFAGKESDGSSARSFKLDSFVAIQRREKKSGYELVLYPTVQLGDGRDANISWLQELPDPVSKIVWDNYLNVSIGTAEKEKLKDGDMVTLTVGDK
ncbi:MAG: TAT-variant-translocated molybdopterin oxidoreductase, partial [Pseudobdellovibrionaceae bacterium]